MQITFISQQQAIVWGLVLLSAACFYVLLVRPRIKDHPDFDRFRGQALAWLKVRWDMTGAALIAAAPTLWNAALDAIIWLSLFLEQAVPALSGLDLSKLVLPDWLETGIRVSAVLLPIARNLILRRKED